MLDKKFAAEQFELLPVIYFQNICIVACIFIHKNKRNALYSKAKRCVYCGICNMELELTNLVIASIIT